MKWLAAIVAWFLSPRSVPVVTPPAPVPDPVIPPKQPVADPLPPKIKTMQDQLYVLAKSLLGQHLTLNEAVPWMVGCAEAISYLLKHFGVPGIPSKGIEGTAALLAFLKASPRFEETNGYEPGNIIINATGTGNGKVRGHVGICGNDYIMSNSSETGKWDVKWSWTGAKDAQHWREYYEQYGGIPTRFFRPI